jgi:hypothetical protein
VHQISSQWSILSPKKIIHTTQKTLFVSRKFFLNGNMIALTLTLEVDLDHLTHACGNGR